MLGFLEKLTLRPDELTADDATQVRSAGIPDAAIVDAIHVAALFNMITRLADALGWDVPSWDEFESSAEATLATDYTLKGLQET
jgi:hypothetical protein